MDRNNSTLLIEGAEVIFRNFAGKEGKFNPPGQRNFCLILPEDIAEEMRRDGWNVKELKPREEGDNPRSYIQVKLKYGKGRPPTVAMISSRGRTNLDEDMIQILDWVEYKNVDLIIRRWDWEINGKTGVAAYLKSFFVTIVEDALEQKYREIGYADESPLSIEAPKDDMPTGSVIQGEILGEG
jgi:hypothetical protein